MCGEKIDPLMNIVALEQAVGGERSVTKAVGASIGEQHGEAVGEEKASVSGGAEAVVADAVEKKNVVSVGVIGMDSPGAKSCAVGRGDGGVGEFGVEIMGGLARGGDVFSGQRAANRMERGIGDENAADDRENGVQD